MAQPIVPLKILLRAFPGIPRDEAQELISSGGVRTYPPNTVMCHEDAFESVFYIILEGEVKVTKAIAHDQVRFLTELYAGDFFGEMAIIHNAPRAATVTSVHPTTVLEIHKDAFNALLRHSASLARAMVHEVSRRLRENDAMAIEDLRMKAGELASAYQQLAEQEYARREFLTTIAHELRTPLTAASGFLQLLQSGKLGSAGLDSEAQQSALESVSRNIQQIVILVNDILFLQEMDLILPRFQPVDICAILRTLIEQSRPAAQENNIEFVLDIPADVPDVAGDTKSLERALHAVLDNAIKFNDEGDKVEVSVSHDDKNVQIVVRDYGVGIPPDVLPHIFDRFFHLDQMGGRVFRGVGLGLSIARQVIEQHQGKIRVQSEVNQGTTVIISLNISE